jgi:enterochelin esterase-like enzyme
MKILALLAALLPGFTPVASGAAGGAVIQGVIPGTTRASLVYVPPGFSTGRSYPVAYLLHGMPGSPMEYVKALGLADVADRLISSGKTRPFIAVLPVAGDSGHYDGEWTGPWEDEVVADVPWVDSHLPAIRSARGRVLAGLSAGGYGAVDIGLRHLGLFGTLESWSGYFVPFEDGSLKGLDKAQLAAYDPRALVRRKAAALRRLGVRFFLSTGPNHGHVHASQTKDFAAELRSLGIHYKLWLLPKNRPTRIYYTQLVEGLGFAFGKTGPAPHP